MFSSRFVQYGRIILDLFFFLNKIAVNTIPTIHGCFAIIGNKKLICHNSSFFIYKSKNNNKNHPFRDMQISQLWDNKRFRILYNYLRVSFSITCILVFTIRPGKKTFFFFLEWRKRGTKGSSTHIKNIYIQVCCLALVLLQCRRLGEEGDGTEWIQVDLRSDAVALCAGPCWRFAILE